MNRKLSLCEREAWMLAGKLLKNLGPDIRCARVAKTNKVAIFLSPHAVHFQPVLCVSVLAVALSSLGSSNQWEDELCLHYK